MAYPATTVNRISEPFEETSSSMWGVIEVFILCEGRLVAHRGFDPGDASGLARFAEEVLARPRENGSRSEKEGTNEARIVAAYLRRRQAVVEAVRLKEARDLLEVAERVAEAAAPLA